jgi:hypothetical protein
MKFWEIYNDEVKKQMLLDSLCSGITSSSDFRVSLEYVMSKIHMFDIPEFNNLYEDEDDIFVLILPSFRRAWGKVYMKPPSIFNYKSDKLELFKLNFDTDEFLEYLRDMFLKTKGCLTDFEYIDRTNEHLQLIVDNYIALLIKRVTDCEDIKRELRNLKIKKITK